MEQSKELTNVIAGWFQAAARGDATYADRYVSKSPRTLLVGTDPEEWIRGKEAGKFLSQEAQAMGGQIKVSVDEVAAYKEGSV